MGEWCSVLEVAQRKTVRDRDGGPEDKFFFTCGIKIPILTLSALHDCREDYIRPDWKVLCVH